MGKTYFFLNFALYVQIIGWAAIHPAHPMTTPLEYPDCTILFDFRLSKVVIIDFLLQYTFLKILVTVSKEHRVIISNLASFLVVLTLKT